MKADAEPDEPKPPEEPATGERNTAFSVASAAQRFAWITASRSGRPAKRTMAATSAPENASPAPVVSIAATCSGAIR